MSNDRRKHPRKVTNDYFMVYNTDNGELVGRLLDLSPEGAMIAGDCNVTIGREINCRLAFPRWHGLIRSLLFKAVSRWCRHNKRHDWYETGYQMTKVSNEDLQLLAELTGEWEIKEDTRTYRINIGNKPT